MWDITINIIEGVYFNFKDTPVIERVTNLGYYIFDIKRMCTKLPEEVRDFMWITKNGKLTLSKKVKEMDINTLKDIIKQVRYLRYKINDLYGGRLNDLSITIFINNNELKIELPDSINDYNINVMRDDSIIDFIAIHVEKDCFIDLKGE